MKEPSLSREEAAQYRSVLANNPVVGRVHRLAKEANPYLFSPNDDKNTLEKTALGSAFSEGWNQHAKFIENIDSESPQAPVVEHLDMNRY